jgi:hypothetical protein
MRQVSDSIQMQNSTPFNEGCGFDQAGEACKGQRGSIGGYIFLSSAYW